MISVLPKTTSESQISCLKANPTVCEYQPPVRSRNPSNEPFIGYNIPNNQLRRSARWDYGFTLIELVVTMAIAIILVAVAVPSFRLVTQNSRMTTQVNDLISDMNFARSEAIKRRAPVSICTSSDGATCSGGNWKDGRIVTVAAVVLRYREPFKNSTDTLTTTGPNPLVFDSKGGIPLGISFTFCDDRGASYGKRVLLNLIGQAMIERTVPPATCL